MKNCQTWSSFRIFFEIFGDLNPDRLEAPGGKGHGFFIGIAVSQSVSEKYSGQPGGGTGWLGLLLLGHRFLSNRLPRCASPCNPLRSPFRSRPIFQTRSQQNTANYFFFSLASQRQKRMISTLLNNL
jgi:hypothetical protein